MFAIATGYLLSQTVFQIVFSHVSHAVGRKYTYLFGIAVYIAGAAIAASSSRTEVLVGARGVQGVGAAGMLTMSAMLIVEMMQPRERAAWTSVSSASSALGNICGPLFAGLLFKRFTWVSFSSRRASSHRTLRQLSWCAVVL